MSRLLDLPPELLAMILHRLDFEDLERLLNTCSSLRDEFHLKTFFDALLEVDTDRKNQLYRELPFLLRHHALLYLFEDSGYRFDYEPLIELGASFAPIPHGKALTETFLRYGDGPRFQFMLDHGASFAAIPGGINRLLEICIRNNRRHDAEDLLKRGAALRNMPTSFEDLIDELVKAKRDWSDWAELIINKGPFQGLSDPMKEVLVTVMSSDGFGDAVEACVEEIPTAAQYLLEKCFECEYFEGASRVVSCYEFPVKQMKLLNGRTLESLIEDGSDLTDVGKTSLWRAAHLGDLGLVETLVERGVPVNEAISRRGETPLSAAFTHNHRDVVSYLLAHGANPSQSCNRGITPLHRAIRYDCAANTVKELISWGADVNARTLDSGATPLHDALHLSNAIVVDALLDAGPDCSIADSRGWKAIHHAASGGKVSSLVRLIEQGEDPEDETHDPTDGGWTPLLAAARSGDRAVVQMLHQTYGANLHQLTYKGLTGLHVMAEHPANIDTIQYFIKHGADVNATARGGQTPLHAAASTDNHTLVRALVAGGANIEAAAAGGRTPLAYAVEGGMFWAAQFLLARGAKVASAPRGQYSPIFRAAADNNPYMVWLLIGYGANVNEANDAGQTPMHVAARNAATHALRLLLHAGACVHATDGSDSTALHFAVEVDAWTCVELLLQHGADPNVRSTTEGLAAIHIAASRGHLKSLTRLLRQRRADLDQPAFNGLRAIHLACLAGQDRIVSCLVAYGVSIDSPAERSGTTPLGLAASWGDLAMVKYLTMSGADPRITDRAGDSALTMATNNDHPEVATFLVTFLLGIY